MESLFLCKLEPYSVFHKKFFAIFQFPCVLELRRNDFKSHALKPLLPEMKVNINHQKYTQLKY